MEKVAFNISDHFNSPPILELLVQNGRQIIDEDSKSNIKAAIKENLKEILHLSPDDTISSKQTFATLGVTRVLAMQLRHALQPLVPKQFLKISEFGESATVSSLTTYLLGLSNSNVNEYDDRIAQQLAVSAELALYKSDALLPTDIKAAIRNGVVVPTTLRNVLLTGANGFLGRNFLLELISVTEEDTTIYCLMRANTIEDGMQKLLKALPSYQRNVIELSKVKIVLGDITADRLGMPLEKYLALVEIVDTVVHCAAKVSHIDRYHHEGSMKDLRTQNVVGLKHILRFATGAKKIKALFHASSTFPNPDIVLGKSLKTIPNSNVPADEDYPDIRRIRECIDMVEDQINTISTLGNNFDAFPTITTTLDLAGYSISKIICEELIAAAEELGMPIITARFPFIIGDSEGRDSSWRSIDNHFWSLLMSYAATRKIPSILRAYPIIAVDLAARICVGLLKNPNAEKGVYFLTAGTILTNEDIQDIFVRRFEYEDMAIVKYKKWRDAVFELPSESNPLLPFERIYTKSNDDVLLALEGIHWDTAPYASLSQKLVRNSPEVSDIMVPVKTIIERHLEAEFSNRVITPIRD